MADEPTKAEIMDYVRARLAEPESGFTVSTSSFRWQGEALALTELGDIWAAACPYTSPAMQRALKHVGHEQTRREKRQVQAAVARYDAMPRSDHALRTWLSLLEKPHTPPDQHEASVFAMKQWIWQVKQAVAQRKARWHLTPIFWSREQGTGKSYNVLRILEPFSVFTRHLFVDALDDSFSGPMFANTYIAFLDEFAGAEQVNTAKLKAFMSGKEIQQRGIHSSYGVSVENRISFIATSNEEPPHGLEDVTGARRLWSIQCSGKSMQNDAERRLAFDMLDVASIWACVHTDDPCPHETLAPAMQRYMDQVREENLRSKTSLETFVGEMCARVDNAPPIPLKQFREAATRYAWETKQVPIKGSYEKFAAMLRGLGIRVAQPKGYWYVHGIHMREPEAA